MARPSTGSAVLATVSYVDPHRDPLLICNALSILDALPCASFAHFTCVRSLFHTQRCVCAAAIAAPAPTTATASTTYLSEIIAGLS